MRQASLVASSLALVAAGPCPYRDLIGVKYILAADGFCTDSRVCSLDSTCASQPTNVDLATVTSFYGFGAVGNLKNYAPPDIILYNSSMMTLRDMSLPSTLTSLAFLNIGSLKLNTLSQNLPNTISEIYAVNCSLTAIPDELVWPSQLFRLSLNQNAFTSIPPNLPASLKEFYIFNNKITEVVNLDLSQLNMVNLGNNSISTLANIKLSPKLAYFGCSGCPITNLTLSNSSFTILDSLQPSNGTYGFDMTTNITIDAKSCRAINGVVQLLWSKKSKGSYQACVVPDSASPSPSVVPSDESSRDQAKASTSPTTNNVAVTVVVVVSVVVVLALLAFVLYKKRQKHLRAQSSSLEYSMYASPLHAHDDEAPPVRRGKELRGTFNSSSDMGTARSTGTGPLPSVRTEAADVDVAELRMHRLELADLSVTSDKPLATGAFGEVWAGLYAGEQVAVKRIKDRSAASVAQFIQEISLMTRMESRYIVKFIGVSWRRPIDIECIVEYMDLGDLRSYLSQTTAATFLWADKFQSIVSIIQGLVYLHTFNPPIIHRDLKSRNVLLDSKKGTKLTDFGCSREADELMTNGIGTYQWMAPEIIVGTEYSEAADIFSFGVIMSEFSTHQVPYAGLVNPTTGNRATQQYITNKVTAGELFPAFDAASSPTWVEEVALQCMSRDPVDRPTALQLAAILHRFK